MTTEELLKMDAELDKKFNESMAKFDENTFALYEELVEPVSVLEKEASIVENAKREISRINSLKVKKRWVCVILVVIWWIAGSIGMVIGNILNINGIEMVIAYAGVICGGVILYKYHKKSKEQKIKEQEEIYNLHIRKFNEVKNKVSKKLAMVPQEYQNSYALAFLANQYRSGRVDTVREARLAYDKHCHELRMERNQEEIIRQNNQLLRNQNALSSQIKRDTTDIIMSMFLK